MQESLFFTFPEREPSFCRKLHQLFQDLPSAFFLWSELESGSHVLIINIRSDQVSRLIHFLAILEDGGAGIQLINIRMRCWKVICATRVTGIVTTRPRSAAKELFVLCILLRATELFIASFLKHRESGIHRKTCES